MIDTSSQLFSNTFIFRNEEQLEEYISNKITYNPVSYHLKIILGILTLILPVFNLFMVYRSVIYQPEDFADIYSVFHSIIFYGEFTLVHLLLFYTLIKFLIENFKNKYVLCSGQGRWINLLDVEFTLMAFNMIKLIPIISLTGFNFLSTQIYVCTPIFKKYSKSIRIILFCIFIFVISFQIIFLISLLLLLLLIKVYQVSFVGQTRNPSNWPINQWLLFLGFSANIINITDTPTITQLAFMWNITSRIWSNDSNMWIPDRLLLKRKIYIYDRFCEKFGFIKSFFWIRTMSAIDVHSLVRLSPSVERISENF
ncbi:unnamed protein product [Adineta steineri]|uniref:Uncharacterized protein n=1 Tax=Adineta steineri TaxID=433720 RepID=A0A815A2K9_9BILA|nr:unnamed protein product [Adineta steineri]CAF1249214.1 unnamed protein product [Adineta steineri]CAF4083507.1 unnamed protein product [Adineta steineri]